MADVWAPSRGKESYDLFLKYWEQLDDDDPDKEEGIAATVDLKKPTIRMLRCVPRTKM